jgi:protoheme IX farnesyltransferase
MAIAWLYRDEYSRAGFKMLPVFDPSGARTSRHALAHTAGLVAASIAPFALGYAGPFYLAAALVLGIVFLATGILFARDLTKARARQFFYASIIYLPLLLITMVLDRVAT